MQDLQNSEVLGATAGSGKIRLVEYSVVLVISVELWRSPTEHPKNWLAVDAALRGDGTTTPA